MRSFLSDASRLTVAMLVVWGLAGLVAWKLHGLSGFELTGYAFAACLLPGWLAFVVPAVYRAPAAPLAAIVVGMTLRMACCGAGLLLVSRLRPDLGPKPFVWWLIVFYLASLAVETYLLVRRFGLQKTA